MPVLVTRSLRQNFPVALGCAKARHETAASDSLAKAYFYSVAAGKSTISNGPLQVSEAAAIPPNPRRRDHDRNIKSPPPAVAFELRASIRPIPLCHNLQTYFSDMKYVMTSTCHPQAIHDAARGIVSCLLEDESVLPVLAADIYASAVAKMEYSRTVALVLHDAIVELSGNHEKWMLGATLREHVVQETFSAFGRCWDPPNVSIHSLQRTNNSHRFCRMPCTLSLPRLGLNRFLQRARCPVIEITRSWSFWVTCSQWALSMSATCKL